MGGIMMDLALFQENFEILRKSSGKWVDKQLVMMTAAQCAAKGKRINESDFKHVIDKVKKSSSAFSPLRTVAFSISGLIYTKTNHYDDEIDILHRNYQELKNIGFRTSLHTYMAATLVEKDTDVNKLKSIYDEMKKYHPFLTSSDDYTAAVIIAKQPERVSDLVERAERYYNALNEKGLSKGNDLQLLANMLVMNGDYSQELTRNVIQTKEAFEKNHYKIRKIHYPSLGIIALSNGTNKAVKLVQDLTAMKIFKWYKDMALTIASLFLSQDYADAPAGLTAAVEAMIQAQQAAMVAATTATISASAASTSGD